MEKKKIVRYLLGVFIFLSVAIVISILPFGISESDKLHFMTITIIGVWSGTLGTLFYMWKISKI